MRQTKTRGGIYIFDSHFVFYLFEVNFAAILIFFQILFVSTVYTWSTKSLQISRIIVSMFSGIIIVTVNIKKRRNIEFEGQIKVVSFQKTFLE